MYKREYFQAIVDRVPSDIEGYNKGSGMFFHTRLQGEP